MSKKREVTVTLETVTPMFLGGVDQQPEIRPAPFRGALRFWLRALLGAHYGGDWKKLHDEYESQVFGSTEKSSDIITTVYRTPALYSDFDFESQKQGVQYLFFPMRPTNTQKGEGKKTARIPIKANESFTLKLRERMWAKSRSFELACAALWLSTQFGAVGTRNRRGAGSIRVVDIANVQNWPTELPSLIPDAENIDQYVDWLQNGLSMLRTFCETELYLKLASKPADDYDTLHPDSCSIYVNSDMYDSWQNVLDIAGKSLRDYRSYKSNGATDYANIRSAQPKGSSLGPIERAGFGMPIGFRSRSSGPLGELQPEKQSRRGSPLIIKVGKVSNFVGDKKFFLQVVLFKSNVLPPKERIALIKKGKGNIAYGPAPNLHMVEGFVKSLGLTEVHYEN